MKIAHHVQFHVSTFLIVSHLKLQFILHSQSEIAVVNPAEGRLRTFEDISLRQS